MKRSLLSNSIEQLLTEATRFGSKESAEVLKFANAFRIGMEFEFHVSKFYTEEDEDILNSYLEHEEAEYYANDKINQRYGKGIEQLLANIDDLANGGVVDHYLKIADFSDVMEDGEGLDEEGYLSDEYNEIFNSLTDPQFGLLSNALYSTLQEIISYGGTGSEKTLPTPIVDGLDEILDDELSYLLAHIPETLKVIEDIRRNLQKNPAGIRKTVASIVLSDHFMLVLQTAEDLDGFDSTSANTQLMKTSAIEEMLIEFKTDWAIRAYNEDYREAAANSNSEKAVSYVRGLMEANPIYSSTLKEVVVDPSVKDGAEVITAPLDLKQAVSSLGDYLDFIKTEGATSDFTGLHINISHRFFRTNRIEHINFLKMAILLDPDMIQTMSKNEKRKGWKERNDMVAAVGRVIDYEIDSMIRAYKVGGFKELEQSLMSRIVRAEKYKSVNFTNSVLSTPKNERRVELRYPGGKGYENRQEDILREMLFGCYAVLAAIEPEFLKQDYLKGILRFLDRATKKKYGMSFLDAVKR